MVKMTQNKALLALALALALRACETKRDDAVAETDEPASEPPTPNGPEGGQ